MSDLPDAQAILKALDATWPARSRRRLGGWIIREGAGGGQRVSAATADAAATAASPGETPDLPDIAAAEAAMRALGQRPLFQLRPGQEALDAALAARGYARKDRSLLHVCETAALTTRPVPPVSAFAIWPPLAIQRELWAEGGIGPARIAVMMRVRGPRCALLARANDRPAATAFVAIEQKIAMLHALEVAPEHRRSGVGLNMLRAAAHWAQENGARVLSLTVTAANAPANALYSKAGMTVVGQYHYRVQQEEQGRGKA